MNADDGIFISASVARDRDAALKMGRGRAQMNADDGIFISASVARDRDAALKMGRGRAQMNADDGIFILLVSPATGTLP